MISIIQQIMATPCQHPTKPLFVFDLWIEAAHTKIIILMHKGWGDLIKAIEAQQTSPLGYGLEFKPVETLVPLFKHHPSWNKMKAVLSHGSVWPLASLSKDERIKDVKEALKFGNQKGTEQQQDLLKKLVKDDVGWGFALLFPLHNIASVPGILLAPLNIQLQKP